MINNVLKAAQLSQVEISIVKAEDKEILNNLLSYHMHDLSEFVDDLNINEKGFFQFDAIDMYFEKDSLIPLLYKVNGEYAGFVLLNKPPYAPKDIDYCINEFFILKRYRRKGYAKAAIEKVFTMYPGKYVVLQVKKNIAAVSFWHSVYEKCNIIYKERELEFDGCDSLLQEFTVDK